MIFITLARKPIDQKNLADNIREHGSGCLNIDGTRIPGPPWKWGTQTDIRGGGYGSKRPSDGHVYGRDIEGSPLGRWPSNLIFLEDLEPEGSFFKTVEP